MLRASGHHHRNDYHLRPVTAGTGTTGVPAGNLLVHFADAALGHDPKRLDSVRNEVKAVIGEPGMIDAAAVIGGFDGITRIADATGIPLEPAKAEAAADFFADLNLGQFRAEKV